MMPGGEAWSSLESAERPMRGEVKEENLFLGIFPRCIDDGRRKTFPLVCFEQTSTQSGLKFLVGLSNSVSYLKNLAIKQHN